jgi:hypothetical protein
MSWTWDHAGEGLMASGEPRQLLPSCLCAKSVLPTAAAPRSAANAVASLCTLSLSVSAAEVHFDGQSGMNDMEASAPGMRNNQEQVETLMGIILD